MADWESCGEAGQGAYGGYSSAGRGINARSSRNRAYYSARERGYVDLDQVVDHGGHYTHAHTGERLYPHGEGGHCPIRYGDGD